MTLTDIKAVNQAQPDLAGFIFAKGRHQIDLTLALKLRQALDKSIKSVGVFVNAPVDKMLKVFDSGAISMIQLHGQESEQTVLALQKHQIPVINVFKPTTKIPQTRADYIMLDSGSGDGQPVVWEKLKLQTNKPLIIAGALNIDNVIEAIRTTQPTLVDLSRGVETDGRKDPQKILKIVKLVHQYNGGISDGRNKK